jgi:hypothetical protein
LGGMDIDAFVVVNNRPQLVPPLQR